MKRERKMHLLLQKVAGFLLIFTMCRAIFAIGGTMKEIFASYAIILLGAYLLGTNKDVTEF